MGAKEDVARARNLLDEGEVVGMPTETVYGLAARIDIPSAIEKIFRTKDRPFFDPLIVHVASIEQARQATAHFSHVAEILAHVFWPGPLTLILPKAPSVNSLITSGLESVGLRMPQHPQALELIRKVGVPLAAPSANKFGRTSPTTAFHVREEFKNEGVFVIDGGDCEVGIESTVVLLKEKQDKTEISILRKGAILQSDIEKILTKAQVPFEFVIATDKKSAPGQMKHHYMPSVPLIICAHSDISEERLLQDINNRMADMPDEIDSVKIIKQPQGIRSFALLKLSEDPVLATRELYSQMRRTANQGKDSLVFYREAHHVGERWESLFDRLNKAASLIL